MASITRKWENITLSVGKYFLWVFPRLYQQQPYCRGRLSWVGRIYKSFSIEVDDPQMDEYVMVSRTDINMTNRAFPNIIIILLLECCKTCNHIMCKAQYQLPICPRGTSFPCHRNYVCVFHCFRSFSGRFSFRSSSHSHIVLMSPKSSNNHSIVQYLSGPRLTVLFVVFLLISTVTLVSEKIEFLPLLIPHSLVVQCWR